MSPREPITWALWVIALCWAAWFIIWLIAGVRTKPTVRRESITSRLGYLSAIAASALLLLLGRRTPLGTAIDASGPPAAWLYVRFVRLYVGAVWIGAPLVLAGLLLALWARLHLADNWSGTVTLKQDHVLIRTGPYRYVRHPIYTGMLLAVAGTACALGQLRGLIALLLTFGAFWFKSRLEERYMIERFADAYRRYQREVKALIPRLL